MLLAASKILKAATPLITKQIAGFSSAFTFPNNSSAVNPDLIFPFQKNNTLQALREVEKTFSEQERFNKENLIILDKLNEQSTTFRAFDKNKEVFVAQKTLRLNSESAWKQLNLAIRQYYIRRPSLAHVLSFDYKESTNDVEIYTEIQNMMLADYAGHKLNRQMPWTKDQLQLFTWQLLNQQKVMSELGATCESLKPEHMFIDQKAGILKLYDFVGFDINPKKEFKTATREDFMKEFDRAVQTLANIVSPYDEISSPEEAREFFSSFAPDFSSMLEQFRIRLNLIGENRAFDTNERILAETMFDNSTKPLFIDKNYDIHLRNELIKHLPRSYNQDILYNMSETVAQINKALDEINSNLEKFHSTENQNSLTEKFSLEKYNHIQNTKKEEYLSQAKVHRAMGDYKKSTEYFRKALNLSNDLYNMNMKYGMSEIQKQTISSENYSTPESQVKQTLNAESLDGGIKEVPAEKSKFQKVLDSMFVELPLRIIVFPIQMIIFIFILAIPVILFGGVCTLLETYGPKARRSNSPESEMLPSIEAQIQENLSKSKPKKERTPEEIEAMQTKIMFGIYSLALSLGLLI